MNRSWLVWWLCILLILGSAVGAWATLDQRSQKVRGWENATDTLGLPQRLPLAGVNVDLAQYDPDVLDRELGRIADAGFVWVRQSFLWSDIEPEAGEYAWARYDAIVAAVDAYPALQLVAVLDGSPAWARHPLAPDHPFAPPESVADYAGFAELLARRYADSIDYYQIWDEPNIKLHWGNLDPRPAHYTAMLRAAYERIHAADPVASVIAAALAPTVETGPDNLNEVAYLRAMYAQGARGYFDAAAGKPYGFNSGPYDRRVDLDILNFSRLILLREQMVAHGDADKPLWGSNFGWNHLPDDWPGPPSIWGSVTAEQRERYTRDAFNRARTEWPWSGGLIMQHWQPDAPADDPLQGFAIAPMLDDWLARGPLYTSDAMFPGLYPAQNSYTSYSGDWRFSALGADATIPDLAAVTEDTANHITVTFEGTAFAMPVRRGDYLAYLYVTVDGEPANALPRNRDGDAFIILTSPERTATLDLIEVANGLSEGVHTAEITHLPSQGDDRWPVAGFAVAVPPDTTRYHAVILACAVIGGLALLGVIGLGMRLPWRNVTPLAPPTLKQAADWLLALLASFLVLAANLVTWSETIPGLLRRDQPALAITILTAGVASLSPVFVLKLAALLILLVLIYSRPLLGVMLVVFWSAFYISNLDLLFHTFTTVEIYLVLTAFVLAAHVVVQWARGGRDEATERRYVQRIRFAPVDYLVLAFVVLGVASLAWAPLRGYAVRELRVVILGPALFYFVMRYLHLTRRDLFWLVEILLFTGTAIAVVGLVLFASGENVVDAENGARRLTSVYGSPNGVGLYLGRCLPFAAGYMLFSPRGSWRWLYGAITGAVMLLAVLLSQSRGAIVLGLPAALIVGLVFWRGRRAAIPVMVSLVGLVVILIPLSLVLPRLADLFGDTFMFRRHLWYSSLQLIEDRPLTGAGLDQFLYLYRSRYLLPQAWEEPNLSMPHDILLNYWVSLGLLGVVLAGAFQVWFWRNLWRVRNRVTRDPLLLALVIGLAGSMADFLAHGLVDIAYFAINLAFVFFLSLALLVRIDQFAGPLDPEREPVV